jgi:hypothetical protein
MTSLRNGGGGSTFGRCSQRSTDGSAVRLESDMVMPI